MSLAYLAAFLAVLFLIAAAQTWWRVAREGDKDQLNPKAVLGVARVRMAAAATAIAFWLLAVALGAVLADRL